MYIKSKNNLQKYHKTRTKYNPLKYKINREKKETGLAESLG